MFVSVYFQGVIFKGCVVSVSSRVFNTGIGVKNQFQLPIAFVPNAKALHNATKQTYIH